MEQNVVPEQEHGSKVDTDFSCTTTSRGEALALFRLSAGRLLNVNEWDTLCGPASAKFEVTDSNGVPVDAHATEGYFFRISIPAPGPVEGEGYDWVRVEMIGHLRDQGKDEEQVSMRVRPAASPVTDGTGIAHFFGQEATSTFQVTRTGCVVMASVHGRNETANSDTSNLADKVRNAVVSLGARAGFSSIQWSRLVRGLIEGSESSER